MARFLSLLLWTAVFLLTLLALDQLLVRVPATQPTHAAIATFYRELRGRLFDLATGRAVSPVKIPAAPVSPGKPAAPVRPQAPPKKTPTSIEAVIEKRQPKELPPPAPPTRNQPAPLSAKSQPSPPPSSIESVIEQRQDKNPAEPATKIPAGRPPAPEPAARYLFADDRGILHFAGTLAEIPEQYRDKARLVRE